MTKDEIRQMVIELSDRIYNNPQNLSRQIAELNSAVESITATVMKNIEDLIVELLYELQEDK